MLDRQILQVINSISEPWLDGLFLFVTHFGGVEVLLPVTIALATITALNRQWRATFLVVAGMAGSALLNILIKEWVERARPDLWVSPVIETSYSFPSGHAMGSMTFALIVALLVWGFVKQRSYRWLFVSTLVVYVLLVGFSRLYLGVHYPSDIVGGWVFSAAWIVIVWHLARLMFRQK